MIHEKSYTPHWVEAKLKEVGASSYDLAEKMVYAFTLLEHLSLKGLQFIFKGGTCLAMMTDQFHRFSKDIDILMPEEPANLSKVFDAIVADSPFTRWEESIRRRDEFQVPKKHFKFYYVEGKPMGMSEKPILLDIIFVENTYPKTQRIKLKSTLLVTEEPHTEIEAPTFESLAGDKLTAFACNTIGIPIGKNKELEIAKQLFDLGMLHGRIFSTEVVRSSFLQTAAMCITAYHKPYNPQDVYDDILSVAFTMAMNGKHNKPLFDEIKRGISGLADYLSRGTKFGYEAATIAAAKVAYLVACLMKGKEMETVAWSIDIQGDYKKRQIEHPEYGLLNKELKKRNPEAWLYWLHAVAVLAEEPTVLAEAVNGELAARGQALPMTITSVPEPPNRSTVNDLAFIVSGRPTIVSGVSGSEPLATAVQQALNQTGNSGRPLDQWLVKLGIINLEISKNIDSFQFPADAKLFVSLKSGAGG